jgi:sensor domain CHASE-containing protein
VLPAAQSHIAGERKRSRWSKARLSLVVPIGAIVAVAIVCVVVAVLTSAKRADEVSLNREQLLLQEAVVAKGMHMLRVLESAAATPKATAELRNGFDAQWADRRIGKWLQSFYTQDIVVIVDGNDRITYSLFRSPGDAVAGDLGAQIKSSLDLLRGRLDAVPEHAVAVNARQSPAAARR